jgi:DNA-binding CsgD family transcriptional regulator
MALRSPSVEALARLTDAEVQVLELVALGRTNQAIADARNISPRTVAKHLEHIYRKLEVDNRAAAAGLAANTSARPDGSAGMRTSGVSPMAGRATPRANFLS